MNSKEKEISREIVFPDTLLPFVDDINRLCFRKNDENLSEIDTIFVFGSTSELENMKKSIFHIFNKAPISTIIISGGVSKKTYPLSESLAIFNSIKDIISSDIDVVLEDEASNTKENVELSLKKHPTLITSKLCFVSKYFAAGRSFLTLQKFLPNALIKQYAFVSNDCRPEEWISSPKARSLVYGEIMRIFTYGKRGDIFYDEVKEKVDFLIKKSTGQI